MNIPASQSDTLPSRPWEAVPRWCRRLITLWLLFHIAAILMAPLAIAPSSRLFRTVSRAFRPYLQALYLNNGFHYFAPEPGESTLVSYTVERADGATIEGTIPHRQIWPRLLYHRHFMLTESLSYIPDDLREAWHESYARCTARQHHGRKVHLTQVQHYLPSPDMVLQGVTLDHADSFERTELGVFERNAE